MSTDANRTDQRVCDYYPFPISHAYSYMRTRESPDDRYSAIMSCFEVTLKFISSIALANFMRDVQQDPDLGSIHLFQDLLNTLSRPLSLGHWHDLLHQTLRPYEARRGELIVPELFDFYYRVTEQGNVRSQGQMVQITQRFIQERNEEAHHRSRSPLGTVQRHAQLGELEQGLRSLLQELAFLADYQLLYVEHAQLYEGRWHYRANFAVGAGHPFRQGTCEMDLGVNSNHCLLMREGESAVLDLHPFLIVTSEGRLQQADIFFFDGIFSSGQAHFMNYHFTDYIEPTDESLPAAVASDALNSLLSFLQKQLPPTGDDVEREIPERLIPIEVYQEAVRWAWDKGERRYVSLDALRQVLKLTREEALRQERAMEVQRGLQPEAEIEVPFEGVPTWANLAYYILDTSGQEEMSYREVAQEAMQLKALYDTEWQEGGVERATAAVQGVLSRDPRFYRTHRGHYGLTKHNELLANPSWANLAYYVLQRWGKKRKGMYLGEITERAMELKEKYSDWRRQGVKTPKNTVSATMSVDHRFEPTPQQGYWRLAKEGSKAQVPAVPRPVDRTSRQEAYGAVLAKLERLGSLEKLPFGQNYYVLEGQIHLMFRFSKAHRRRDEVEYFLGVIPEYAKRIHDMGHGFMVFVLGGPDNVLLVPTQRFSQWVEGVEPSASGTWPLSFYQPPARDKVELWVSGKERADVTAYLNDFDHLRKVLGVKQQPKRRPLSRKTIRMRELFEAGLIQGGDKIYVKQHPRQKATAVDPRTVGYNGQTMSYNAWGQLVTGWVSINIYREAVLKRTGETLDELREKLGKQTG